MTLALEAQLVSVSLASSLLGGVLGMASGIFIVPLLVGLLGLDIRAAIAASIISVVACSAGGSGAGLRAGLVNIRLAVVLEVATTLGALSGVLVFGLVPIAWLYGLFAAILLLSARQMWQPRGVPVTGGRACRIGLGHGGGAGRARDAAFVEREAALAVRGHPGRARNRDAPEGIWRGWRAGRAWIAPGQAWRARWPAC
jgi:uncharacterized protein